MQTIEQKNSYYEPEAKQLQLFKQSVPKKPYCTDWLESGLQIRNATTATRKKYIQVNPPWLRSFLVFDIDRPQAAVAWQDANLPEPFWTSQNPENGHAHLCFALDAPVLLGHHDRQHPMRYLSAVEAALSAKLDADPNYSGLITKNPLNSHWRTFWNKSDSGIYNLNYLEEFLDLKKFVNRKAKPELTGIGRNVDTFDHLRHQAYRMVAGWKREGGQGVYVRWLNHLYDLATQYTHNEHPSPLDFKEAHHIAKSVASWTWNKFDVSASNERFAQRQAHRGRLSGAARLMASEDKRATARLMTASGHTQTEIAEVVKVNQSTIARWLK